MLNIGAVFPQTEFPADPAAVRDYIQTIEGLGYSDLIAYDHVLGANPDRPGGWKGTYTFRDSFLEPFVLFSFAAGITPNLGYMPGVLILPQRQTALVAKQAATLDVLCRGRFRLGVGLGWNEVEYQALDQDFHTRGKRIEEQVEVLRKLWTEPLVTYQGRWHTIPDAGINPLPVQRPVPIWFGGSVEAAVERAARLGDGWLPNFRSYADARSALDTIRRTLEKSGRDPAGFGIEPRLAYGDGNPAGWVSEMKNWQSAGATGFSFNTMKAGFETPAAHLAALKMFMEAVSSLS